MPFRMAFGLEVVMMIEFQVFSLRVQITELLSEFESEQLLELKEECIASFARLGHSQRRQKAFID